LVIKASAHRQIEALVRDLASDSAATRDAAVARLTVIGARAVGRLTEVAGAASGSPQARAAAFRALERLGDQHALDAALAGIGDADLMVAIAATGAARSLFDSPRGVEAVDGLTAAALDRTRPPKIRLAAARALRDLPRATVAPIFAELEGDPNPELATLGAALGGRRPRPGTRTPGPPLDATPLEDPDGLRRRLLSETGARLPLASLHRLVQRLREREEEEAPGRRAAWTTARAAAHAALAARGSKVALYDLKESLETAREPLPVEFLTALTALGDTSCLESIAAAYSRAVNGRDNGWWRRHLSDSFKAIVKRERITRRHAVMKRIEKRWPAILNSESGIRNRER